MRTPHYYCPECKLVLKEHELDTETEYVTSEYFGQIECTPMRYSVCGACHSDVEECCPCERCQSALPVFGENECSSCLIQIEQEEQAALSILRPMECA